MDYPTKVEIDEKVLNALITASRYKLASLDEPLLDDIAASVPAEYIEPHESGEGEQLTKLRPDK